MSGGGECPVMAGGGEMGNCGRGAELNGAPGGTREGAVGRRRWSNVEHLPPLTPAAPKTAIADICFPDRTLSHNHHLALIIPTSMVNANI